MTCPTCDHTVQQIETNGTTWWCPRCGTLTTKLGHEKPKLVDRCRKFQDKELFEKDWTTTRSWRQLGIAESINLPNARKDQTNDNQ